MHEDPEVMKFVGGVRSKEETECWLQDNLQHWDVHGFGLWTFRQISHGTLVGRRGLRRVQLDSADEVELGYSLVRQYWGKGLATEMVKAILAIGFEDIGLETVIALIDASNSRSTSVALQVKPYDDLETGRVLCASHPPLLFFRGDFLLQLFEPVQHHVDLRGSLGLLLVSLEHQKALAIRGDVVVRR